MTSVRTIGPGRAGGSFAAALGAAGWEVRPALRRGDDLAGAATDVDVLLICVPDANVADVATAVRPHPGCVTVHVAGSLGLEPLAGHPRRAVVHPLVALPDPELGAARLQGAWFALDAEGDPAAAEVVAALRGRPVTVAADAWVHHHAAAVIASNHLVALMGQVERVAAGAGVPVGAYLELAAQSLDNVVALGPAAALTGPVRRGDRRTVERHRAALPAGERAAYDALVEEALKLCP